MIAEMVEVPSGASDALADAYNREACGLIYVIEGRLQLDAGGLHEVLETGDCVFIESQIPLVWSAGNKRPCRVLAVRPAKLPG
jgi:quercetin dioxygenase-like cupin family protein